jgi:hypothetical protein
MLLHAPDTLFWIGSAGTRFTKFVSGVAWSSLDQAADSFAKSISVSARPHGAARLSIRLMESLEKPLIAR